MKFVPPAQHLELNIGFDNIFCYDVYLYIIFKVDIAVVNVICTLLCTYNSKLNIDKLKSIVPNGL